MAITNLDVSDGSNVAKMGTYWQDLTKEQIKSYKLTVAVVGETITKEELWKS